MSAGVLLGVDVVSTVLGRLEAALLSAPGKPPLGALGKAGKPGGNGDCDCPELLGNPLHRPWQLSRGGADSQRTLY